VIVAYKKPVYCFTAVVTNFKTDLSLIDKKNSLKP